MLGFVKPLGTIAFYYVASPSFIAKHGNPQSPQQLSEFLGILPNYTQIATPLFHYNDSNNTVMLAQMAIAGMGAAILPEWLIVEALQQGKLVKLFDEAFNSTPIYAVYMNRAFLASKIRVLIDFLSARLKA